mmetsp:Transcript_141771/g.317582  ORF Transcript_141771/g.317582 Transcript_141771/m.317582 type:complete len:212 (-) Transcript_141771:30-665(-)
MARTVLQGEFWEVTSDPNSILTGRPSRCTPLLRCRHHPHHHNPTSQCRCPPADLGVPDLPKATGARLRMSGQAAGVQSDRSPQLKVVSSAPWHSTQATAAPVFVMSSIITKILLLLVGVSQHTICRRTCCYPPWCVAYFVHKLCVRYRPQRRTLQGLWPAGWQSLVPLAVPRAHHSLAHTGPPVTGPLERQNHELGAACRSPPEDLTSSHR